MKISTQEDIALPADDLYRILCNAEEHERAALRRGVALRRKSSPGPVCAGAAWEAEFDIRGRRREVLVTATELVPAKSLRFDIISRNVTGEARFELMALSAQRTRLVLGLEVRPRTISARLVLQSIKLTKKSVDARFKKRVADYARQLEVRFRSGA
ncbi:MAG: SRPBCC family protein [Pseudomonadota bacterium]